MNSQDTSIIEVKKPILIRRKTTDFELNHEKDKILQILEEGDYSQPEYTEIPIQNSNICSVS